MHEWQQAFAGGALITGASRGLGAAFAHALATAGLPLTLVARDAAALRTLADALHARHRVRVRVLACDLAAPHAATTLLDRLAAEDIAPGLLINNAGFGVRGAHAGSDPADDAAMLALHTGLPTALCRGLLPGMLARGHGRILNVASTAAFMPAPGMAIYHAAKAYLLSYSEALAQELAGSGVSVTALCPGPVATGFATRAGLSESRLFRWLPVADAARVAHCGLVAAAAGRPVAIPGLGNRLLAYGARITPRRLVMRVVAALEGGPR